MKVDRSHFIDQNSASYTFLFMILKTLYASILQWNLDLTTCHGTGEIGSLYRGFVSSRFFSLHYTITGMQNIVRYTEDFVI